MSQLFLCHYRGDADEVQELATVLRLYGIQPWLDREGGFLLGDSFVGEAKRAIQQECFGMILYATPEAFERPFIRRIELNEAIQRAERDPNFVLITLLRRLSIPELAELSRRHLGIDLSLYHAHQLHDPDAQPGQSLTAQFQEVATHILSRLLRTSKQAAVQHDILPLQYATRELFPTDDDVLTIDATRLFPAVGLPETETWERIATALFTIKRQITAHYGRPRLHVHGSKHLTAATLFGYVFRASSGFQLEIRQREGVWATDCIPAQQTNLDVRQEYGSYQTDSLFVEVSITGKSVRDAVRRYVQQTDLYPFLSLRCSLPIEQCTAGGIDNAGCCAMAHQIGQEIATAVSQNEISEIHLFAAVPQALTMMIGYQLNALRPVQLYEYVNGVYRPSYRIAMDGR